MLPAFHRAWLRIYDAMAFHSMLAPRRGRIQVRDLEDERIRDGEHQDRLVHPVEGDGRSEPDAPPEHARQVPSAAISAPADATFE